MKREEIIKKLIEKAEGNGLKLNLYLAYLKLSLGMSKPDMIIVDNSRWYCSVIFDMDFAKALWGEEMMYMIDASPEWAHDMGDVEIAWVNEEDLKKYCKAEMDHFRKEHKISSQNKNYVDMFLKSIMTKWEDPFEFAITEIFAWEYHLQQLVSLNDEQRFAYLERFV